MTPQQLKAMKQALEALELLTGAWQTFDALDYGDKAITAIKEALAEHAMQEVQRLGQEIEQVPVAWINPDEQNARKAFHWVKSEEFSSAVYTTPPQRKPLTDEQRKDLMNKAWKKRLSGKTDNRPFAWHFSFEVEAAHGIKENT